MSYDPLQSDSFHSQSGQGRDAEETLRLVAQLPPPPDIADRVHHRLAAEQMAQASPARRGFWSLWMPAQRLQFAAAAVLVIAVAGSTWSVYHMHPRTTNAAPAAASSAPGGGTASEGARGGFRSAAAERVPPTLNPIKVAPAPKKKPGAGHVAKPSAKALAVQSSTGQTNANTTKPAANQ